MFICKDFFETLQHIYNLYYVIIYWKINRLENRSVCNTLSETQWGCQMENVKAVHLRAAELCNALEELQKTLMIFKQKLIHNHYLLVSQMLNYKIFYALYFMK